MKTGFWSVKFELTLDGQSVRWEDLPETAQSDILAMIANDYLSGELCIVDEGN